MSVERQQPEQLIFETVACLLCGSNQYQSVLTNPDYGERIAGQFRLVRCQQCGLFYQNPRPTSATIGLAYPDHYSAYASQSLRRRKGLLGWLTERGMRRRLALLDAAVPAQPGIQRRLLDIGSGAGVFLESAKRYGGWELHGLEPNHRAATATRERLGISVLHGTLEQANYAAQSFDAVTLWDVLEHLHDPVASLRTIRQILKPHGVVMLRVPNADSITRLLARRYWAGYDLPRHMTIFGTATLQRALASAGFGRVMHSYTAGSYLYLNHSLRFALGDRPHTQANALRAYQILYHPFMRALLGAPWLLVDRLGRGGALEMLVRASV